MKIEVLTFGIARDITGADTLQLQLPSGATVAELRAELAKQFPAFEKLRSLMVAVNAAYASDETILTERDELALIPPVSGG